jgi:hypothetical protein
MRVKVAHLPVFDSFGLSLARLEENTSPFKPKILVKYSIEIRKRRIKSVFRFIRGRLHEAFSNPVSSEIYGLCETSDHA